MKTNGKTHIKYDEQMNERLSCVTCSECDIVAMQLQHAAKKHSKTAKFECTRTVKWLCKD